MERKFLRYALVAVIFFVGLSMGVSYQNNNRNDLQESLTSYEKEITEPGNDFTPVDPTVNPDNIYDDAPNINHNLFTGLAKDGEYVLKKGIELVLEKSDDLFRFIFGVRD